MEQNKRKVSAVGCVSLVNPKTADPPEDFPKMRFSKKG